ncbi:MAG: molybdate ABC transporter substrate-binding protein, partial [Armatimonadetes bacterium]|nr:molybdate ABC transporter substrate-binding protein [Armatimonadota bacterium]
MRTWMSAPLLLVAVALLAGCPPRQSAQQVPTPSGPPANEPGLNAGGPITGEIQAYIPCGMIIPMRAAVQAFEAKHPGVKVKGIYDNAGIIVKRLTEKGEKADVVVSPGQTEMDKLEAAGLMDTSSKQILGTFELVCIMPSNSRQLLKTPADLKACKTIAMPNPDVNSTGASGREALTKLGLWDTLKPKMLLPNHAIEAHTMVAGGKADAGIAYRNCPLETNPDKLSKSKVRIAFAFPPDSYAKQPCLVEVCAKAPNKTAADALVQFLSSDEGRKILADNGMTGCLDMAACAVPTASGQPAGAGAKPDIAVVAYYPGNEKHKPLRELVEGLP